MTLCIILLFSYIIFTIYSVIIYWDVSKYSLSSLNSSKKVKKCYSILHENPPPYKTENWVTPFPCSLPRLNHIKINCNVCNGSGLPLPPTMTPSGTRSTRTCTRSTKTLRTAVNKDWDKTTLLGTGKKKNSWNLVNLSYD